MLLINRKIVIVLFLSLCFFTGTKKVFAQINLVPNCSFEEYTSCPTSQEQIFLSVPWTRATTDYPEYFNACADSISDADVPDNILGHQFARTGSAYAAFGAGIYQNANVREYLSVQLTDSLLKDTTYKVSFFVSLGELSSLAIDNIGAYFSKDSVYVSTPYPLPYTPQIKSTPGYSIKDTVNWIEVGGQYTSLGGERFLIIGCFVLDSLLSIDTIYNSTWNQTFYYVDDVVVTSDTSWGVGLEEQQISGNRQLNVFPNPTEGQFTVSGFKFPVEKTDVYNILGELVFSNEQRTTNKEQQIDLSKEPAGIYFVKVGHYFAKVIKE